METTATAVEWPNIAMALKVLTLTVHGAGMKYV